MMSVNKTMHVITCFILLNTATVTSITCDEYLQFPPEYTLLELDLQLMPPNEIVQCVPQLGRDRIRLQEAEFIWKTIIRYYEGIANIPDEVLAKLHWITIAITPQEYANITLGDIDVIENFGLNYDLNEKQLSALATRVLEDFASKEPEDYTCYDLSAIRQILCAFNRSIIERIHPEAYKEACVVIGKLENCSPETMFAFTALAVRDEAFGPPRDWSVYTIRAVGKIVDYLPIQFQLKFNRFRPRSTPAPKLELNS